MKKILFTQTYNVDIIVKDGNPIGGSVVETLVWMESFHQLGFKVLQFRNEEDKRKLLPQYEWVELLPTYKSNKGIRWIRWVYYRLPVIFKKLKKTRPDYIYESIPSWGTFFYALMCRQLKIKLILRVANDNMLDDRILITHSKFGKFLIYKSFAMADFILPQNKFQHDRLVSLFPGKKILKIYNPFVIDYKYLLAKKEMKGYIAWVANFRYQKNPELLYKIAKSFPKESFKVAGKPISTMDQETGGFIELLNKLPNVEFVGVVERKEILSFFSHAKFLLNTSRYEGFSNTFLEAMSTGTPILTTNNVNPDGIINRFDLGWIYENEDDLQLIFNELFDVDYLRKSNNCLQYIQHFHDHLELGKTLIDFLEISDKDMDGNFDK